MPSLTSKTCIKGHERSSIVINSTEKDIMGMQFLICMNRQGKVRLAKYYKEFSNEEKHTLVAAIHKLISSREHRHHSNFVEFQNSKLVYKRYAGVFFITGIDLDENELMYLSSIHLLVEVLDECFESVNELDLVFNFHKVYQVLDEMFAAGEIQETSKVVIINRLAEVEVLE